MKTAVSVLLSNLKSLWSTKKNFNSQSRWKHIFKRKKLLIRFQRQFWKPYRLKKPFFSENPIFLKRNLNQFWQCCQNYIPPVQRNIDNFEDLVWKCFSCINIIGLWAKSFRTLDQNFVPGLWKLFPTRLDERFRSCKKFQQKWTQLDPAQLKADEFGKSRVRRIATFEWMVFFPFFDNCGK